jgi:phenylalanyl-tRNA synthetase alpha chain
VDEAVALFAAIGDAHALEEAKARYLGKTGVLTEALKGLGKLPPEERRAMGSRINAAKDRLEAALREQRERLQTQQLEAKLREEALDVTLPGRGMGKGGLHPVSRTLQREEGLFRSVGFEVADGPEIESDYYNFTALNQPENHPARSMHDTFYLADGKQLLRTHTSPIQVRYMETHRPPIKIIAPGRVYRVDSDATHSPMFHQVEGLWIDEYISFADLKGVVADFFRRFFERDDIRVRFRPSFFPFTEPSLEVDIQCRRDKGEIRFGEGEDWLEILGCGMVHPNVLRACGIDPDVYQGFAWGMGLDRIAMLKYGIADLRQLFDSDVRWLSHYGFKPLDVPTLAGGLST